MVELMKLRKQYSRNSAFKSSTKLKTLLKGSIDFEHVQADEEPKPFGRPEISFTESSQRSKRIKRDQIIDANSPNRLIAAGNKVNFSQTGIDLSKVQKHMEDADLSTSDIISNSILMQSISYNTPEECLKLYTEMNLTRSTYQTLRNNAVRKGLKRLYCSYKKIQAEKWKCIPISLNCMDYYFEVDGYDLAKQTVARLMKYSKKHDSNFRNSIINVQINELDLECKFGLDGAQSGTNYSHHFEEVGRSDSNFVLVTMVPLRLKINGSIIWTNNKPNSVNFT